MVELKGTEKQAEWAHLIRQQALEELPSVYHPELLQVTDAQWLIGYRAFLPARLAARAAKRDMSLGCQIFAEGTAILRCAKIEAEMDRDHAIPRKIESRDFVVDEDAFQVALGHEVEPTYRATLYRVYYATVRRWCETRRLLPSGRALAEIDELGKELFEGQ